MIRNPGPATTLVSGGGVRVCADIDTWMGWSGATLAVALPGVTAALLRGRRRQCKGEGVTCTPGKAGRVRRRGGVRVCADIDTWEAGAAQRSGACPWRPRSSRPLVGVGGA